MNYHTCDGAIMLFIMVAIVCFEAVSTLLSIFEKGILKDPRKELMKKTNKQLRDLLKGKKKISGLRKHELVEMVLTIT